MATLLPRMTPRMRNIAMEFLAFQEGDKIGVQMEEQVSKILNRLKDEPKIKDIDLPDTPEGKALTKLIFDRFGIKVDFICDEHLAAIIPFYSNRNHIFLHEMLRGDITKRDQQKILNQSQTQKGVVNREKVYVSGIFSEYEHELYMNFRQLAAINLTAPEIVAVLLHELGHAFNACEYSDRMETNNQVLADVFREMTQSNDKRDMVYIYRELKKVNKDVTEAEVDTIVNGNRVIAGYTWFKVIIGSVQGQLSNQTYSKTSFEAGSDMFANRFGYGRQIVSALDKLNKSSFWTSGSHTQIWLSYFLQTMSFVLTALMIHNRLAMGGFFLAFGLTGFGVITLTHALWMIFILVMAIRASGEDVRDFSYDEIKVRYGRIRNDLIEFLKRAKLSTDRTREVVDSIKDIDAVIHTSAEAKNLYTVLANVIFPGARAGANSVAEQQLLEKLTSSDLFLHSAELRLAAAE